MITMTMVASCVSTVEGKSSQPVDDLGCGVCVGFDAARHAAQIHGEHHDHGGHQQRQTGPGQIAEVARAARSDNRRCTVRNRCCRRLPGCPVR